MDPHVGRSVDQRSECNESGVRVGKDPEVPRGGAEGDISGDADMGRTGSEGST